MPRVTPIYAVALSRAPAAARVDGRMGTHTGTHADTDSHTGTHTADHTALFGHAVDKLRA
jgi:hypothetical protein